MVHTHMHVREDAMVLFGFLDTFEREVFRLLIGVNGIGPKLAINILSGIGADELVASIGGEDLRRLNAIPGVGKKLAERIVLELRGKVPARGHAAPPTPALAAKGGVWADLQSALVNLGYKPARVDKALDELREGGAAGDLQTLLREALRLVT
jgi:Holliday junction DNA helicase RuvA